MHTIIKRAVLAAIVLLIETTSNSSFPMMFFVRCVCEEAIHTHLSCTHTHTAMIKKGIFWKAKLSKNKFSPKIKIVFIFPRVELHGTPSHNRAFCLSLRTPFIARINPSGLVMSWWAPLQMSDVRTSYPAIPGKVCGQGWWIQNSKC